MQRLVTLCFFLLAGLSLMAQNIQVQQPVTKNNIVRCDHDNLMQQLIDQNPSLLQNIQQQKQAALQYMNNAPESQMVVTIPVHVVVVHGGQAVGTTYNISLAQIQSQIDVLNEDYRRLNSDASNTPSAFSGIAADVGFEFCLATVDPSGNPTSGITRVNGGSNTYSSSTIDNSIKPNYNWDPSSYLNIYVANISGGTLGYAYFPGISPAYLDGVVVTTTAFGRVGYVGAPFDEGRTATHEIGHYFGLSHVWGNSGGCGDDDGIGDTPNSSGPYYGCPSFGQSSCGSTDMFMNYMDYVDDDCMNLFTAAQATYMNAVLNANRSGLIGGGLCGVSAVSAAFTPLNPTVTEGGSVSYTDQSTGSPTSWSWTFQGGSPSSYSGQNPPAITYNTAGTYSVSLTVSDGSTTDTETGSVTVNTPGTGGGDCDTLTNIPAAATLTVYGSSGYGYVSGHNNYLDIAKADLFVNPSIGDEVVGTYVYFVVAVAGNSNSTVDVTVWDNDGTGGAPGTELASETVTIQSIATDVANNDLTWVPFSNPPSPSGNYYVGVEFVNGTGDTIAIVTTTDGDGPNTAWEQWNTGDWYSYDQYPTSWGLDLSHVILPVMCPPAATCTAPDSIWEKNLKPTSVKLVWTDVPSADSYEVHGRQVGTGGWVTIPVAGGLTEKKVTGLVPNTAYRWEIRSICDGGATVSDYSSRNDFTTLCLSPDTLGEVNLTANSVQLRWNQIAGVVGYEIRGRKASGGGWVTININTTVGFKNVPGLEPNTTYEWQIRSKCDASGLLGEWSPLSTFTTPNTFARFGTDIQTDWELYPNPSQGALMIRTGLMEDTDVQVIIRNQLGQTAWAMDYGMVQGNFSADLDLSELAPGLYLVELRSGVSTQTIKWIKE